MDDEAFAQLVASLTAAGVPVDPTLLQQTASPMGAFQGATQDTTQPQRGYSAGLPAWVRNIAPQILEENDVDPYMRVFWGGTKEYDIVAPDYSDGASRGSGDGVDFRSGGAAVSGPSLVESTTTADKTLTIQQAQNKPYTWDEEKVAEVMGRMREAGIGVGSFDEMVSVWGSLVERAALTYSASKGERKLTPWDVLDLYKSEAKAAGTWQDQSGNYTRKTVQRNVTDVTEGEAWSMIQSQLQQMLGRDPSDQEVRDFTYRMNRMAAENPSISKTITKYRNGEAVSSSTKTKTGFSTADMAHEAYDQAQNDPEYGEYQAATTYFNAVMGALGPIGG